MKARIPFALCAILLCLGAAPDAPTAAEHAKLKEELRLAKIQISILENRNARLRAQNTELKRQLAEALKPTPPARTKAAPKLAWEEILRVERYQSGRERCTFAGRTGKRRNGIAAGDGPGLVYRFKTDRPWRVRWAMSGDRKFQIITAPQQDPKRKGKRKRMKEVVIVKAQGTNEGTSAVLRTRGAFELYVDAPYMSTTLIVEQRGEE